MGKMKNSVYPSVICFVTGLLWGVIIGAISISVLVSYRMDSFYERITYLENTISDKDEKLARLEESINNSNIILKDIDIELEFGELSADQIDKIDNMKIEKAIKEKYGALLGKEIKDFDADILLQVIDKRILKFEGGEYQLTVNKLVLTDILKLWVEVSPVEVES